MQFRRSHTASSNGKNFLLAMSMTPHPFLFGTMLISVGWIVCRRLSFLFSFFFVSPPREITNLSYLFFIFLIQSFFF
jgi:hypothetical protein